MFNQKDIAFEKELIGKFFINAKNETNNWKLKCLSTPFPFHNQSFTPKLDFCFIVKILSKNALHF
jgi:hypothetical protein